MALPATDSFTNSNGVQLATHDASWTVNAGDFDIQSNSLAPDVSGECWAYWNADSFDDDQYAQAGIVAVQGNGSAMGVVVRSHASAQSGYSFTVDNYGSPARQLYRLDSGSLTTLASDGTSESSLPVTYRIEAEGTSIRALREGANLWGDQTDATYSSGSAGIHGRYDTSLTRLDDWEGGNLGAAGGALPMAMNTYRQRRIA